MAGADDVVKAALKLIAGGSDDAAKRIASIRRSEPFPADYIEPGSVRYRYEHPDTSSFMEIITRPKGARSASVIGLEVPEEYRGTGIGKALQERVLQDYPSLMGQVSSKAAAVNAYKAGRRPLANPNATLEDVFKMIDEDSSVNLATEKNIGGSIREGYGPGGWVDDVVKMAGKAVMGGGEKAVGIIPGTFPGKKLPRVDALANNVDKFVYHSGVAEDIPSMKHGVDPQIGPWIKEVLEGSAEDDLVNEIMENAVPVSWWSKRPDWAVMKVARKLGKNPKDVTPEELAQHGHVALIPKKDPEAESMYWVGEQGLSSGLYSEVEDITGRKLKAYETDLYSGNYGPEGVERNEYITPRSVEPYLHLTGNELLDFLRKTGDYNKSSGGRIAKGGGGSFLDDALRMAGKAIFGEGEDAAKAGIRAYHGSPHDFDRFDMSKIGTGEGAQAYGHGLYFAENERVAKGYRDALSSNKFSYGNVRPDDEAIQKFSNQLSDIERRKAGLVDKDGFISLDASADDLASLQAEEDKVRNMMVMDTINRNPHLQYGRMYEVNINADPNAFLDWDKPLSEQPQNVLDVARPFFSEGLPERKQYGEIVKGGDLYDMLVQRSGGVMHGPKLDAAGIPSRLPGGTKERLGMYLSSQGIPGIKYLDAGSRGAGDGTRNYVVFDDKLISIIRKYGIAGASAMLGYNLMEQLDPKQALAASMADQDYQASRPRQSAGGNNAVSGALNVARGLNGVK